MTIPRRDSLVRQDGKCFLNTQNGIFVVPTPESEYKNIRNNIMKNLEEKKKELWKEILSSEKKHLYTNKSGGCALCFSSSMPNTFLFPVYKNFHQLVCQTCIAYDIENGTARTHCRESGCSDYMFTKREAGIAADEEYVKKMHGQYKRALEEHKNERRPGILSVFNLNTETLPADYSFLTDTVLLEDTAVSKDLFLMLLERTNTKIGKNFSVFGGENNENCIKEHPCLDQISLVRMCLQEDAHEPGLLLENIRNMPPRSISCVCKEIELENTFLIEILPKLRLSEENMVERLVLNVSWTKTVLEIQTTLPRSIYIGRVRRRGFNVKKEIGLKLDYTLVDEKGNTECLLD
ncbi:MAG: uncharacterized protein A8A55_2003 [Amphiamblys sp. WSBS2006]|nr:MAG: uncharacterized protein A8A55_2003 [Amphiamblys sp. WSBS2006]